MIMSLIVALGCLVAFPDSAFAQRRMDTSKLPKYVVIETNDGRGITIDTRRSPDAPGLEILEDYLKSKNGEQIRTLTDLLNVMDQLGYDYVDTFLGQARGMSIGGGISSSNFSVNVIFRKREGEAGGE